jgi:hypothetical protein
VTPSVSSSDTTPSAGGGDGGSPGAPRAGGATEGRRTDVKWRISRLALAPSRLSWR